MLVHFFSRDVRVIEHLPGMQHHLRQRGKLGAVHPANPGGHQPRRHLVIGDFPARVTGHEKVDFLVGKFPGITFFADQINGAHACGKRWRE